jgi:hypothetical protein
MERRVRRRAAWPRRRLLCACLGEQGGDFLLAAVVGEAVHEAGERCRVFLIERAGSVRYRRTVRPSAGAGGQRLR